MHVIDLTNPNCPLFTGCTMTMGEGGLVVEPNQPNILQLLKNIIAFAEGIPEGERRKVTLNGECQPWIYIATHSILSQVFAECYRNYSGAH